MITGLNKIKDAFLGYEDCYVIIGGTACSILLEQADLPFRTTKDFDIILLIENRFEEFSARLWEFINKGEYKYGWKNSEKAQFFRFSEPKTNGFPKMIELFSKNPGYHLQNPESVVTPLHISDEISSLSAIMLNQEYYELMLQRKIVLDGVSILDADCLIPFKMKAWLDLREKKQQGKHVNSDDIKKHYRDVFRLMRIIPVGDKYEVSEGIKADIREFLDLISKENVDLKSISKDLTMESAVERLKEMYMIE